MSLLAAQGHDVICPDLPGHGHNPAAIASISLKTYVTCICDVLQAFDQPVILVGHSMSGMVISQVAEQIPEKVVRLVYLSAYLPGNNQNVFDLIAANRGDGPPTPIETAMILSEDKRTCLINDDNIGPLFYNRCPEPSIVPTTFPPQATLPLAGKVTLSEKYFGQMPKSYICCLDDQVIPISHQRQMLKHQPCNEMIQLDADHSPFLSCTDILASILHSISLVE